MTFPFFFSSCRLYALQLIFLQWMTLALFATESPRTFTASDGRKLGATLLSKSTTTATIRSANDGKTYTLPLDHFSATDQDYIRNWEGGPAGPPPDIASGPITPEAVDAALAEARRLSASGDPAGALAIYEAIAARPPSSQVTVMVRLFAMFPDWAKLAASHPPALEALRKIRATRATALLTGEAGKEFFSQVAGIDRAMVTVDPSSQGTTVRLFQQIDEKHPDLARDCFPVAKSALREAGERELFAKYVPDLGMELESGISEYKAQYAVLKPRNGDALIAGNAEELRTLATFLTEIAESRGDTALADELQVKVDTALKEPAPAAPAP